MDSKIMIFIQQGCIKSDSKDIHINGCIYTHTRVAMQNILKKSNFYVPLKKVIYLCVEKHMGK